MYEAVDRSMFHQRFKDYGRQDNFSRAGLDALYDYLEEIEDYELDVIAICCEYSEDKIVNALKENGVESIEELGEETVVIWHDEEDVLYLQY